MSIKVYARFNNARKNKFELTTIAEKINDSTSFVKYANNPNATEFLNTLIEKYNILKDSSYNPVHCYKKSGKIYFSRAIGKSFDEILLECVYKHDSKSFKKYLKDFDSLLKKNISKNKIVNNEEFKNIYGDQNKDDLKWNMMSVSCIDFIFDNVFFDEKNNKYTLIDYEWVMSFPIPYKYVLWRSLYAFYQKYYDYQLNSFMDSLEKIYDEFNISEAERELFIKWEYNFQKYVRDTMPMSLREFKSSIVSLENDPRLHNRVFLKSTCEKIALEGKIVNVKKSLALHKIKNLYLKMKRLLKHVYLKTRIIIFGR